jgi:hypothetical protein
MTIPAIAPPLRLGVLALVGGSVVAVDEGEDVDDKVDDEAPDEDADQVACEEPATLEDMAPRNFWGKVNRPLPLAQHPTLLAPQHHSSLSALPLYAVRDALPAELRGVHMLRQLRPVKLGSAQKFV